MNDALRDALLDYTDRHPGRNGVSATAVPGLVVVRGDRKTMLEHVFYKPALIVVFQGSKDVWLDHARFSYVAGQYLVLSVGLPVLASITEASVERPYLALGLAIDFGTIRDLIERVDRVPDLTPAPDRLGLFVGQLAGQQADGFARLAALLATPDALRILFPSIAREIFYWTLTGSDGGRIRRLTAPDSHTQRIAEAVGAMRAAFAEGLSIERLAAVAHMSLSSFHHHFKAVTSLSPLQYQKQLRLLEARRRMLANGTDAARAAYEVGYESASQFSREYARMFGAPPRRDIAAARP